MPSVFSVVVGAVTSFVMSGSGWGCQAMLNHCPQTVGEQMEKKRFSRFALWPFLLQGCAYPTPQRGSNVGRAAKPVATGTQIGCMVSQETARTSNTSVRWVCCKTRTERRGSPSKLRTLIKGRLPFCAGCERRPQTAAKPVQAGERLGNWTAIDGAPGRTDPCRWQCTCGHVVNYSWGRIAAKLAKAKAAGCAKCRNRARKPQESPYRALNPYAVNARQMRRDLAGDNDPEWQPQLVRVPLEAYRKFSRYTEEGLDGELDHAVRCLEDI